MKKVALFVVAVALLAGVVSAHARNHEMTGTAGDYSVVLKLDKNPPVKGSSQATIDIRDASGKAVTNAKVTLEYGMPPMPGMGAMNYKRSATLKGESYQASINFSMNGPWYLNVRIAGEGSSHLVKFNVDVR